jgi:hypothetical protein
LELTKVEAEPLALTTGVFALVPEHPAIARSAAVVIVINNPSRGFLPRLLAVARFKVANCIETSPGSASAKNTFRWNRIR